MEKAQLLLMTRELERLGNATERFRREAEDRCEQWEQTVRELEEQKALLREENTTLRRDLSTVKTALERTEKDCALKESTIESLRNELNAAFEKQQETQAKAETALQQTSDLEERLKVRQIALGEMQTQAQQAVSQASSYQESVQKYEELLEVAVSTNKALEQEHQTCLDELQAACERINTLEMSHTAVLSDLQVLREHTEVAESREKALLAQVQSLREGTLQSSEMDLQQYISRKRRLLSLRAHTIEDFFCSLDRSLC